MTGNNKSVVISGTHTDEECAAAAADLIMKYVELCGGSGYTAQLDKRKKRVNIHLKRTCIETADSLAESGLYEDASKIMKSLGYNISTDDKDKLVMKIKSILAKAEFDYHSLPTEESVKENSITKVDFSRERVILMCHYKMYIDSSVWTAEEYAILISQYNEELKRMKASMQKK